MLLNKDNTVPFFATIKSPIEYVEKFNARYKEETVMMSSLWNTVTFHRQITRRDVEDLAPFPSMLAMEGAEVEWPHDNFHIYILYIFHILRIHVIYIN